MKIKHQVIFDLKQILEIEDGYALIYILVITLLVISTLVSFMSIIYFYNKMSLKFLTKTKLDYACYSAAQIAASNFNGITDRTIILNVDSIKVKVSEKQFGAYIKINAFAKFHRDSTLYQCFLASRLTSDLSNALTISHPKSTITVAGQTHIYGNIQLTSRNISRGNIFGIRNSNESYLDGQILVNDSLKSNIFENSMVGNIFNKVSSQNKQNEVTLESVTVNKNFLLQHSPDKIYFISGDLTFNDSLSNNDYRYYRFNVTGNVFFRENCYSNINMTIISDQDFIMEPNCHIENTLLASKKKIKADGIFGKNVQLFAKDSITINNSYFSYPSVIVSYNSVNDSIKLNNLISLNNTIMNGTIMLLVPRIGIPGNKSLVLIDGQSKVQGFVYSENDIELQGAITGSVYTYNFWYYKDPTEYINWLVNSTINRAKLDEWFLIPIGFNNNQGYDLLYDKWIY